MVKYLHENEDISREAPSLRSVKLQRVESVGIAQDEMAIMNLLDADERIPDKVMAYRS